MSRNGNGQPRLFEDDDFEPVLERGTSGATEQDLSAMLRALRENAAAQGLEWADSWDETILNAKCHYCTETLGGDSSLRVKEANKEPHYAMLVCGACGNHVYWLPHPATPPRRDSNGAARADWIEYLGVPFLYCAMCGIWESETTASFEMHHVPGILDGCDPHEGRTIPLCQDCHRLAGNLRNHQRHARGLRANQPSAIRITRSGGWGSTQRRPARKQSGP